MNQITNDEKSAWLAQLVFMEYNCAVGIYLRLISSIILSSQLNFAKNIFEINSCLCFAINLADTVVSFNAFDINRQLSYLTAIADSTVGCVSFGQKWKTGTERQYLMDTIGLSSTTVT